MDDKVSKSRSPASSTKSVQHLKFYKLRALHLITRF
jgi:hypothetical protein